MAWRDFTIEIDGAQDVYTNFSFSIPRVQLRVTLGEKTFKSEVLEVRSKTITLKKRLVFRSPSGSRVKLDLIQIHNIAQPELIASAEIELAALIRGFDGFLALRGAGGDLIANFKVNMFFASPDSPRLVRQNQRTFSNVSDTLPLAVATATFPVEIAPKVFGKGSHNCCESFKPVQVSDSKLIDSHRLIDATTMTVTGPEVVFMMDANI